jgi:hypothetical protein
LAGGDWKAELCKRAVSTRAALNRHRWAIGEMEGRTSHGPNNLASTTRSSGACAPPGSRSR